MPWVNRRTGQRVGTPRFGGYNPYGGGYDPYGGGYDPYTRSVSPYMGGGPQYGFPGAYPAASQPYSSATDSTARQRARAIFSGEPAVFTQDYNPERERLTRMYLEQMKAGVYKPAAPMPAPAPGYGRGGAPLWATPPIRPTPGGETREIPRGTRWGMSGGGEGQGIMPQPSYQPPQVGRPTPPVPFDWKEAFSPRTTDIGMYQRLRPDELAAFGSMVRATRGQSMPDWEEQQKQYRPQQSRAAFGRF